MEELLKKLLESELLTETTKESIERAFRKKLDETKTEIEAKVREELAHKNKVSRDLLINACEAMIRDGLKKELTEFSIDHKQAKRMSVRAARTIAEAEGKSKQKLDATVKVMESLLRDQLKVELKEFHQDQKVNRTATLRAINETKARAEHDRKLFVKRGAKILETIVEKQLRAKLTELHTDIVEARKNDMGRRIMEAFGVEFRRTFFNETKETKRLSAQLLQAKTALEESRRSADKERRTLTESVTAEKKTRVRLQEAADRKKIIDGLLSRLTGSAKVQMRELLESARTGNLRGTFRKFLPSVTNANAPRNARLDETRRTVSEASRLRRGNGITESRDSATTREIDEEVAAVARRAGLRAIN